VRFRAASNHHGFTGKEQRSIYLMLKANVKAVTGGILNCLVKALNQDVNRTRRDFKIKGKPQTCLREEMLKYTLQPLWMQKLGQEALFTFMKSKTDQ
jgi:hypothetical protein